ncbi:uncharacterized protein LOC133643217 isoform X2 [Entelurus aequoreus]|uniref:uncharacterized protein LOC133643217 isoform X2 n=1 Tax=Entelurus aequoreus TaxID=161455 RepID=UPI002B1D52C7|nr:uncharacterized protein LOC133643217 isoform X2 [Entelurus aequoreus]
MNNSLKERSVSLCNRLPHWHQSDQNMVEHEDGLLEILQASPRDEDQWKGCASHPDPTPDQFTTEENQMKMDATSTEQQVVHFLQSKDVEGIQNGTAETGKEAERRLSPAERNYDGGNRELLAIHEALVEWRHWLEGAKRPFLVLTDHRNLIHIRSAKRVKSRQARWTQLFCRFEYTLTYRPGSRKGKADSLSRIFSEEPTITEYDSLVSRYYTSSGTPYYPTLHTK